MIEEVVSPVLANAIQAGRETGFAPQQALTASLTAEGLLFAAFSLSYNLVQPREGGRHWFFAQGWFALCIAAAVAAAALSAGASWWATFEPDWPDGANEAMRAGGVAAAIVLQPIFAFVIAWQART